MSSSPLPSSSSLEEEEVDPNQKVATNKKTKLAMLGKNNPAAGMVSALRGAAQKAAGDIRSKHIRIKLQRNNNGSLGSEGEEEQQQQQQEEEPQDDASDDKAKSGDDEDSDLKKKTSAKDHHGEEEKLVETSLPQSSGSGTSDADAAAAATTTTTSSSSAQRGNRAQKEEEETSSHELLEKPLSSFWDRFALVWLQILSADATLIFLASVGLAVTPTWLCWEDCFGRTPTQIPSGWWPVILSWLLVAHTAGWAGRSVLDILLLDQDQAEATANSKRTTTTASNRDADEPHPSMQQASETTRTAAADEQGEVATSTTARATESDGDDNKKVRKGRGGHHRLVQRVLGPARTSNFLRLGNGKLLQRISSGGTKGSSEEVDDGHGDDDDKEKLQKKHHQNHRHRRPAWTQLNSHRSHSSSMGSNRPLSFASLPAWQQKSDPMRAPWSGSATSTITADSTTATNTTNGSNVLLIKRLLQTENFYRVLRKKRRTAAAAAIQQKQEEDTTTAAAAAAATTPSATTASPATDAAEEEAPPPSLGIFDLSDADSLQEYVVESLFVLRGMDIFLSSEDEPASSNIGQHEWLIEHGLRDVPTFIVNVLTQWGNILLYFEMPAWVQDWTSSVQERDDDSAQVKALKRFFNGTDEYRNERLKLIPSLVDGPLAVRVLAPPKKETMVESSFLHVTWTKYNAQDEAATGASSSSNRKLCVALEAELDCMSSRTIRGMAGIVKRHLQSLVIDVAVVIGKSYAGEGGDDEDDEPCCLGLWRFDHVDISGCPVMPDPYASLSAAASHKPDNDDDQIAVEAQHHQEITADVLRASMLVGLSTRQVQEIAAEVS